MKRILTALAVVAMAAAIPTIGSAASTDCSTLAQPFTGTVNGGLTVSDSDSCTLEGATIHGDIDQTGGTLQMDNSTIDGGIDMSDGSLLVCGSRINGRIDATGGSSVVVGAVEQPEDGFPFSGPCNCNRINGNTDVSGITGLVEFDSNTINGGLDLINNGIPTATEVEVEANDIQGQLNCVGNASVTDDGQVNGVTAGPASCPPLSKVKEVPGCTTLSGAS